MQSNLDSARVAGRTGGVPVGEFRLLPHGPVEVDRAARGHSFVWSTAQSWEAVSWFKRRGTRLLIDYEHQSIPDLNTRHDGLAPAAGWIGRLEVRRDGLYACDVQWSDTARALVASGEYAYYSPVVNWRDSDSTQFASLGAVALTNDPAMRGLTSLAASRRAVPHQSSLAGGGVSFVANGDGSQIALRGIYDGNRHFKREYGSFEVFATCMRAAAASEQLIAQAKRDRALAGIPASGFGRDDEAIEEWADREVYDKAPGLKQIFDSARLFCVHMRMERRASGACV